jgi:hypothetical protein
VTTRVEPFGQVGFAIIVREVLSGREVRIENTGGKIHTDALVRRG